VDFNWEDHAVVVLARLVGPVADSLAGCGWRVVSGRLAGWVRVGGWLAVGGWLDENGWLAGCAWLAGAGTERLAVSCRLAGCEWPAGCLAVWLSCDCQAGSLADRLASHLRG
jgi:hypothetical protein